MFTIQYLDHEEGSAAMWHELPNSRHETNEEARKHLRKIHAANDEDCMLSYRVVEVGSDLYYSQPTDMREE